MQMKIWEKLADAEGTSLGKCAGSRSESEQEIL
jgi:hypothetical protein